AHLACDDLRQCGLAEAWRAEQQHVVERLAARPRRLNEDPQVLARLALAHELVEGERPERCFGLVLASLGALGHPAHGASSLRLAFTSASSRASAPSARAAALTAAKASVRG